MSTPSAEDRLKAAKRRLRERRFDEGIAILEGLLAEHPDSAALVQNLGAACFAAGRFDDAITHFEHLLRLTPADATPFVNLGAVLNRTGEYRRAGDMLRKALQRDRKSAAAYYNLGISHRGDGNNAMAVSSYREAIRLDPDMVDAHFNLANVYVEMGNHQQAIIHYKEALTRRPDFTKAQNGLARAERMANESRAAVSPFGRLVQPLATPGKRASDSAHDIILDEEQRTEDRLIVHDVASTIRASLEEMRDALHDRFEPAVTGLNKVVSQGKPASHLLGESHETFQSALERVQVTRRAMEVAIEKLRDHEASFLDEG